MYKIHKVQLHLSLVQLFFIITHFNHLQVNDIETASGYLVEEVLFSTLFKLDLSGRLALFSILLLER